MNPELKIRDAHKLAVLARQRIEQGNSLTHLTYYLTRAHCYI